MKRLLLFFRGSFEQIENVIGGSSRVTHLSEHGGDIASVIGSVVGDVLDDVGIASMNRAQCWVPIGRGVFHRDLPEEISELLG